MKMLGKFLFPKAPFYEQQKKLQALIAAVVVGLIISAIFVVIALKQSHKYGAF